MTPLYVKAGSRFREATMEEIASHCTEKAGATGPSDQIEHPTYHVRRLTVGYDPDIRLKGRWLQHAGFDAGSKVHVHVHQRRLVIDVVNVTSP